MILKYKDFVNENLNEGLSPDVKKARKALAAGKKVFGRHTHPRLSGKEFEILSFSPTGGMAEVMWSDGKKPEDMASFSINKIRVEESVNEGQMDWEDFGPDDIADNFAKDNGKDADGGDLGSWLDMFAMDVGIEDRAHDSFVEEIIDALRSKGFRKIKIEDVDV